MKLKFIIALALSASLVGCGNSDSAGGNSSLSSNSPASAEKSEAKIVVTKYDFFTKGNPNSSASWELSAKGSVQNIGSKDAKNVVVSFVCNDCVKDGDTDMEARIKAGHWIQMAETYAGSRDSIAYLAAGSKEEFEFKVAGAVSIERPSSAPSAEIKIVSFDQVD